MPRNRTPTAPSTTGVLSPNRATSPLRNSDRAMPKMPFEKARPYARFLHFGLMVVVDQVGFSPMDGNSDDEKEKSHGPHETCIQKHIHSPHAEFAGLFGESDNRNDIPLTADLGQHAVTNLIDLAPQHLPAVLAQ